MDLKPRNLGHFRDVTAGTRDGEIPAIGEGQVRESGPILIEVGLFADPLAKANFFLDEVLQDIRLVELGEAVKV